MHFFDLTQRFNLDDILTPLKTLDELKDQSWFLSKVRVEYNCIDDQDILQGQAVLKSSENIQIELDWLILDTGHELQVLFKGLETIMSEETLLIVKGAQLVDENQQKINTQALSLWINGTLLPLIPNIRKEIKASLNLWDYIEYDG